MYADGRGVFGVDKFVCLVVAGASSLARHHTRATKVTVQLYYIAEGVLYTHTLAAELVAL